MARCPKLPVPLPNLDLADDDGGNTINGPALCCISQALQHQELNVAKLLEDQEVMIRKLTDQHHAALRDTLKHELNSMESRLIIALHANASRAFPNHTSQSDAQPHGTNAKLIFTPDSMLLTTRASGSDVELNSSGIQSHFTKIRNNQKHLAAKSEAKLGQALQRKRKRKGSSMLQKMTSSEDTDQFATTFQTTVYSRLYNFARGPLDMIASVLIAVVSVQAILFWEMEGCESNKALGLDSCNAFQRIDPGQFFQISGHAFNSLFAAELILRVLVFGRAFFNSWFNMLDAAVVIYSALDSYVLGAFAVSTGKSVVFARLIRYARFSRTLRLVRQLEIFGPLRILMRTIISSFASLCWSMVILGMAQLLFGLILCQSVTHFIRDESQNYEIRVWANSMYGSSSKAFYTMFEMTLSGGWPRYVRPLVEIASPFYAILCLAYVVFVVFALIRIITALFLRDTMNQANNDADMMMDSVKANRLRFEDKLVELFELSDTDQNGRISFDEFSIVFEDPNVQAWCKAIDIEISEIHDLFDMIDDGDGSVTYTEFVNGMARLRGHATAQDVVAILHDTHNIIHVCESMKEVLNQIIHLSVHEDVVTEGSKL